MKDHICIGYILISNLNLFYFKVNQLLISISDRSRTKRSPTPLSYVSSQFCPRSRKEGNVLFNDALNTFYLRLYGVRHMVKDHSDSEKGNPLPPHRLLFPISSKGSFICTIPHTGQHIPRPLLHQSWITGWNEK